MTYLSQTDQFYLQLESRKLALGLIDMDQAETRIRDRCHNAAVVIGMLPQEAVNRRHEYNIDAAAQGGHYALAV